MTERKLVAASSWPFLIADTQVNGLDEGSRIIAFSLDNKGVGPARIQSARLLLDGRPMHNRLELLHDCCGFQGGDMAAQIADGLRSQNILQGVMSAHDSVTWLAIQQTPTNGPQWRKLESARRHITMDVCYCSVLDDCWSTDLTPTATPARVPHCQGGADDYWD